MGEDVRLKYIDGKPRSDTFNVSTVSAAASGDTEVVAPSAGKRVRVLYLCLNADGANSADVTAGIRFGAAGDIVYLVSLKAGSIFARNIGAGLNYIQGATDEALSVNLSASQTVNCTVEWEEVD